MEDDVERKKMMGDGDKTRLRDEICEDGEEGKKWNGMGWAKIITPCVMKSSLSLSLSHRPFVSHSST